ncbi:NAD(P)H-dependent oxidoreductase [Jannaschia sp. CCS1]|uniref:NAD(P)H-dependent oxidoreductase n=1 Tax=Jannaschia sp. (strain CCS1) TaxID=290400 RepID=UPI000053CAC0|nr:NAD(P)H-dependent oxidoreductase [Jannaschia sp. CCS1]ABD54393.1 NAD(P)H dehydrogenase (quinone) [Jannaschia sp. CCS1]
MAKALVIYAHPVPESLGGAAHMTVVNTLNKMGWEVDDCDLYAERFDPVLSAEERRGYHDTVTNIAPVQAYVNRLRAADAVIFCFPVWNFGYPAILKGWFDRVMLPGVSFQLADGKLTPCLDNIRKLAAVTTYGSTPWRAFLAGDPPKKLLKRVVWGTVRPDKIRYIAQYDMNNITPAGCDAFLARVTREMEAF